MIKLFWNTHNQNKTNFNDLTSKEAKDHIWGVYHKNNSDTWIYEILGKINYKIIENEKDLENGDILIIVDSSVEKKSDFYTKLELICSKMYLIHLGDETSSYDFCLIYNKFSFVWRSFCFQKYFNNKKVNCLPIGYKSGVSIKKDIGDRKYKWAFIGTPHKSSRHDLLFQLSDIKPSFSFKTKKFNEKIMNVNEMNDILSSTEFIPCPNGFVHPETYRLYEALECQCIPIVENAYKYYDRLFPDNPFLKVDRWLEAKNIIKKLNKNEIEKKKKECSEWWINKKVEIQKFIEEKIVT